MPKSLKDSKLPRDHTVTEIILTEKIPNLGSEADVVKVKRGYARNFLNPTGRALEITPATLKRLNLLKAKRAEREAKELNEAEELSRRINKLKITLELETGESGKAFGSITAADLAEKLKSELGGKIEIDRHKIYLDKPIRQTGAHEVEIKLHHDVTAKLVVNVKAKGEAAFENAGPEVRALKIHSEIARLGDELRALNFVEEPKLILRELHDTDSGRIDAQKVADFMRTPLKQLSEGLGLNYKALHRSPAAAGFQVALGPVKRTLELLHEFFGSAESIRIWLNTPHPDLNGASALQTILDGRADAVKLILDNAWNGIPV